MKDMLLETLEKHVFEAKAPKNAIDALASVIPCGYLVRKLAGHAGRDYASFEVEGIGTYLVVPADVVAKVTVYKGTGKGPEVKR